MLLDRVSNYYRISKIDFNRDVFTYIVRTPAFQFFHFILEPQKMDVLFHISIKDDYNKDMLVSFLSFIDENLKIVNKNSLTKIEDIKIEQSKMDAALFLPPEYHNIFKPQDRVLHENTIVAFPVYNCEFTGNESARELIEMRKDFVSTVNWVRSPQPKIKIKFSNPKTRIGTLGKKLGLIKIDTFLMEFENLSGVEGGYMEIENYLGEYVRVLSYADCTFQLNKKDSSILLKGSKEKCWDYLENFLFNGNKN